MNPDDLRDVWQSQKGQERLTIDVERLACEVRRNEQAFAATILFRDIREVGTAVILIVVWVVMGWRMSLPWTWYLEIPSLVWVGGFLVIDRWRRGRVAGKTPPDEPVAETVSLRRHVERSLAEIEHQIWLLRNVVWWYLLPLGLPMIVFFGQVSWRVPGTWWLSLLFFSLMAALVAVVYAAIARLNWDAVRTGLEPRRVELKQLLTSLDDEATS